jgi:GeoRSP system SPASM domain protein
MERLAAGESPLCLTREERACLAGRVAHAAFAGNLQITANDPFLWRVVNPGVPFPDGICQAANTMLAIDPAGNVYPCPAMPVLLGNLQTASCREIVLSALKKEVRAKILEQPSGCTECPMLDDCRGGCRGRGLYSHGSWEKPDPGCGM